MAETTTETDALRDAAVKAIRTTPVFVAPSLLADAILSAVVPLVREQVAAEIEHDFRENVNDVAINDEGDRALGLIANGMYRAARIARGGSR